jgi:hypothetical protein
VVRDNQVGRGHKDCVAAGREFLVRLREVGVPEPATLLIKCFKAGIGDMSKKQISPLLNQREFENGFEALAQEFGRITVSMTRVHSSHAYGIVSHASTTQGGLAAK